MDIYKIYPEISIDISQHDIDDIMVCALEGGINYWCGEVEVVGEHLGEYASEQISRGGKLILHDAESNDKWTLTRADFLDGLKHYIESGGHIIFDEGCIDTSKIDAYDADCIVQLALFGDIVFG